MQTLLNRVVASCFAVCCLTSVAQAEAYKISTVGDWLPWGNAHIAAEKGFWREAGLDMEVRQFSSYPDSLKAFKNERVDFGIMMIGDAVAMIAESPKYIVIYEHDWSHGGDWFVVANNIETVADLKGKIIGVNTRTAPYTFFLQKILATANLRLDDVSIVEIVRHGNLSTAFKLGKFSAIINIEPMVQDIIEEKIGRVLFTAADFEGIIPEGVAVRKSLFTEQPEVIRKFMLGWLKAVQWQVDPAHLDAWLDILNQTTFKNTPQTASDFAALRKGIIIHHELNAINTRNREGLETYIQGLLGHLTQVGVKPSSTKPSDYMQTEIALEAAHEVFRQ